jgi:succinoglycan biosynthesis protein ExoA
VGSRRQPSQERPRKYADRSRAVQDWKPLLKMKSANFDADFGKTPPTVAIAIPTYNEEAYISTALEAFCNSRYPSITDILVIDGMSGDRTQEVVNRYASGDPRIRLVKNPYRFQSQALNIGINCTSADLFIRADAHSLYAEDYIEMCVKEILRTGARNVGGAPRFVAKSPFQAGVAIAAYSSLGRGNAKHRDETYDGFAETVFLGCFWRKDLLAIGGYKTDAVVNEDSELNLRLHNGPFSIQNVTNQDSELNLALGAGKREVVYVSSRIRVWYWPRTTLAGLIKQHVKYGRGRALTCFRHQYIHPRAAFIVFMGAMLVGVAWLDLMVLRTRGLVLLGAAIVMIAGIYAGAAVIVLRLKSKFANEIWRGEVALRPGFLRNVWSTGTCLCAMYNCYLVGLVYQVCKILWRRRIAW